jgi:uncharacterized protein YukE
MEPLVARCTTPSTPLEARMPMHGMDIDRLYSLVQLLQSTSSELEVIRARLRQATVESSSWTGPGSERFRARVEAAQPFIEQLIREMDEAGEDVRRQADEQRQASW